MGKAVAGALAGKHVLLTGVTGFVGEALLQLLLSEVPDVRLTLLVRPKGSTSGADRARAAARQGRSSPARGRRRPARAPDLGPRGRPRRRTRPARPTSTPSCTAPATSRSTRPSTRASAPTWSAPATCSTGCARRAATSTTCTSPRRTSPAGAAARSRRRRVDHAVDVDAELAWGLAQRPSRRAPVPQRRRSWTKLRVPVGARARPGRPAHRGRGGRGPAQGVGQGAAGPDRHRAGPQPRLDRLLHVHQGARRAGRRGARPHRPGLDRPAEHHRVRARAAAPRLDRGLQDGRAADPGLRPRRAAGVPRGRRHHRRHRAGRPRRGRDRRGARHPPGAGRAGVLPRRRPAPATR